MFLVLFTLGMINSARAQYVNPLTYASMIALQVARTSFGFHLKKMYGKLLTPPALKPIAEQSNWKPSWFFFSYSLCISSVEKLRFSHSLLLTVLFFRLNKCTVIQKANNKFFLWIPYLDEVYPNGTGTHRRHLDRTSASTFAITDTHVFFLGLKVTGTYVVTRPKLFKGWTVLSTG